jgi:hypothetical protein
VANQTFPTRNKFPIIGTRGVTYIAQDTDVSYVWNGTGYVPINLFVKKVGDNNPNAQGDVSLPIETVESTTTTFRKAESGTLTATDKIIVLPPKGNFFTSTLSAISQYVINNFDVKVRRVINAGETLTVDGECERFFVQNLYNFGTLRINTTGNVEYGYGIVRVDGILDNEGLIENDGLIIT